MFSKAFLKFIFVGFVEKLSVKTKKWNQILKDKMVKPLRSYRAFKKN